MRITEAPVPKIVTGENPKESIMINEENEIEEGLEEDLEDVDDDFYYYEDDYLDFVLEKKPEIKHSSHYDKLLDEVRKLPCKTSEQKDHKREKAKILGQELLLDSGKSIRVLIQAVKSNPEITENELRKYFKENSLMAHPEVFEAMIDELTKTRDIVDETIYELKEKREIEGSSMDDVLYDWLLSDDNTDEKVMTGPKGKIRLGNKYPLAVVVFIEDYGDYLDITRSKRSLSLSFSFGFFEKREAPCTTRKYPLVVVNSSLIKEDKVKKEAEKHEKKHAEDAIVQNSIRFLEVLGKPKKNFLWTDDMLMYFTKKNKSDLETAYTKDKDSAKKSSLWRDYQEYALTSTKGEILAMLEQGMTIKDAIRDIKKEYEHFIDLGFEVGSEIYDDLIKDYNEVLDDVGQTISKIDDMYSSFFLFDRQDDFRWMLSRIPLRKWTKQLNGFNFVEESDRLSNLLTHCLPSRDDYAIEELSERDRVFEELSQKLQENQGRSFIDIIKKYEIRLGLNDK